jgi:alpha-galactosidase
VVFTLVIVALTLPLYDSDTIPNIVIDNCMSYTAQLPTATVGCHVNADAVHTGREMAANSINDATKIVARRLDITSSPSLGST